MKDNDCELCKILREALSIAIQYVPLYNEKGYDDNVYKEIKHLEELISKLD